MMSEKPFKFKQFTIDQDQCAMKVGTDGVLLGAWATLEDHPFSILDIGAGTGLVALMLAQRSSAQLIDAIEIDHNAYEQCVDNFENSPWSDRLFCYHASLQEFADEIEDKYDLIVSNPPFYTNAFKTNDSQRDLARFEDALPFEDLIKSVTKLLAANGKFVVIVPFNHEDKLISLAKERSLHPSKLLHIKGTPESEIKRSIIEFSFHDVRISTSTLIIENSRHHYTQEYIHLTNAFYLKM